MGLRGLLGGLAALLVIGLAAGVASAQRSGSAESPGFTISAVGQESFFVFDAKPGETIEGSLLISPEDGKSKDIVLKAVDVGTAATGGLDYGSEDPEGVGTWIELSEDEVQLEGSPVEVPFTASVPEDARPGDNFAGIIAYDKKDLEEADSGETVQLEFLSRLAIAVQLKLPNGTDPDVQFEGASIEVAPSGATLQVDIANLGDKLAENIVGNVTLDQGDLNLFSRKMELTSLLPQTTAPYPFEFAETPVEDTYQLVGSYRVDKGPLQEFTADVVFGSEESDEFAEETGREPVRSGMSLLTILLIVLAVLAIVGGIVWARRRGMLGGGSESAGAGAAAGSAAGTRSAISKGGVVDLNAATVDQLASLPGVGRRAAARIVDYREEYGRFSTIWGLERVEGFDAERIEGLKDQVRV